MGNKFGTRLQADKAIRWMQSYRPFTGPSVPRHVAAVIGQLLSDKIKPSGAITEGLSRPLSRRPHLCACPSYDFHFCRFPLMRLVWTKQPESHFYYVILIQLTIGQPYAKSTALSLNHMQMTARTPPQIFEIFCLCVRIFQLQASDRQYKYGDALLNTPCGRNRQFFV